MAYREGHRKVALPPGPTAKASASRPRAEVPGCRGAGVRCRGHKPDPGAMPDLHQPRGEVAAHAPQLHIDGLTDGSYPRASSTTMPYREALMVMTDLVVS
jgi:hypothetical protein